MSVGYATFASGPRGKTAKTSLSFILVPDLDRAKDVPPAIWVHLITPLNEMTIPFQKGALTSERQLGDSQVVFEAVVVRRSKTMAYIYKV